MKNESSAEDNRPDDSRRRGRPAGKRGRIVPAKAFGRAGATVMTIGPAQLEAIKRCRAKGRRDAEG